MLAFLKSLYSFSAINDWITISTPDINRNSVRIVYRVAIKQATFKITRIVNIGYMLEVRFQNNGIRILAKMREKESPLIGPS